VEVEWPTSAFNISWIQPSCSCREPPFDSGSGHGHGVALDFFSGGFLLNN
jgi:hypothetical protein